jgi:NAD(P)-dependent dehydrogenase (short-subunit alcohol dehydrogenase family)
MAGRLEGRVGVVTGVSRGIGRATAWTLIEEGARVYGLSRDPGTGIQAMKALGPAASFVPCDIADPASITAAVGEVLDREGRIDVLVNNAALQRPGTVVDASIEDFDAIVNTNLRGTWLMCRAVLPSMLERGGGAIVNVSSVLGLTSDPELAIYTMTKAGILNLTRAIACTYGPQGVRANAICPADVNTEINLEYLRTQPDPDVFKARLEREYPLRRFAEPIEIGRAIAFLASDDSSFMTGSAMVVDGGVMSRFYEI